MRSRIPFNPKKYALITIFYILLVAPLVLYQNYIAKIDALFGLPFLVVAAVVASILADMLTKQR